MEKWNVINIFKSGTKIQTENYRPIAALTSVPGKLTEIWVNNLFLTAQHGLIKGRLCSTQLLELMDKSTEALDSDEDVIIFYLDFRKAFDKGPHKRLVKKLWGYGIQGEVHSWIKEFLNGRSLTVRTE